MRCVKAAGRSARAPRAGSWAEAVASSTSEQLREVIRLYDVVRLKVLVGQSNTQYLQKARDYICWCDKWDPPYDPTRPSAESIGRYCTHWATVFSTRSLPGLVTSLRAVARDNPEWTLWSASDDAIINKTVKLLQNDKADIDKAKYMYPCMNRVRRRLAQAVRMWNLVEVQDAARLALSVSLMFRPQDSAAGRPRAGDLAFHESDVARVSPSGEMDEESVMQYFSMRVRKGKTFGRVVNVPYVRSEGLLSAFWWLAQYRQLRASWSKSVPEKEAFMFPRVTRSGDEFVVDWKAPMDDEAYYARRAERCLAVGVPSWFVAGMGPYSDRCAGCEESVRAGKSAEWIRRRGGWRTDAWKYYVRASPEQEACRCLGLDEVVAVGDLFGFGPATLDAVTVWAPLPVQPVAERQPYMFAARDVPRGRPQARRGGWMSAQERAVAGGS